MKNLTISEELNRIKFLLNYEKGKVISEQTTTNPNTMGKYKTGQSVTNKTTTETIKVAFTKKADYELNQSDPSKFINEFIVEIFNKIKEKNPDNKPLKLDSITITSGSSNVWGKKTHYDVENDYVTPNQNPKPSTDSGYVNNVKLSNSRAQNFWNYLKSLISKRVEPPKIEILDSMTPTFKSLVVNTNGFDDAINMKKNPTANPGQFVSLSMDFSYVKTTVEPVYENTFGYSPVSTSTYWCDGTDGAGNWRPFTGGCATNKILQTPKEVTGGINDTPPKPYAVKRGANKDNPLHNFITRYQLLFNNQSATWEFKWGNGKIISIVKKDVSGSIGVDPITGNPQVVKGGGEIIGNEILMTELKNAMNFPKYEGGEITDKSFRQSFDFYVQPYR